MGAAGRPIWFVGDPAEPAARAIAAALPAAQTRRIDAAGDLPPAWPTVPADAPAVVVIHRATLGTIDLDRLIRLRDRLGPARRIILCVGPHARHSAVERWAAVVDVVVPELTAATTIARHVATTAEVAARSAVGGTVAVISSDGELRAMLVATLSAAGFDPIERVQPEDSPGLPASPSVWDVPVLVPGWPTRLTRLASFGPTIALIGFLDGVTHQSARAAGASSCLDLPCDAADLVRAVDRAAGIRHDAAHPTPPAMRRGKSDQR